jgi:hypothetical protein
MHLTFKTAFAAAALLAGPALAQNAPPAGEQGGRPLSATLTGAAEKPGPGDGDGSGTFSARVNPGQGQVCYELSVSGIDPATAAHIHAGDPAVAGPVVVPLEAPTDGSSEACAAVARDLAQMLIQAPEDYYVNVHNAAFPAGAIRGQLSK